MKRISPKALNLSIFKSFIFRKKNEYIILYPLEDQNAKEKDKWKIRIHLRGVKKNFYNNFKKNIKDFNCINYLVSF